MLTQIADSIIDNGLIQLGFAGFALIIFLTSVYGVKFLFTQFINVMKDNNRILAKLRETINDNKESIVSVCKEMRDVTKAVDDMGRELHNHSEKVSELDKEVASMKEIVKVKDQ